MLNKLTNILPSERLQILKRGYFIRLATIAIVIISILIVTYGVLRIPSYLYLKARRSELQQTFARLSAQLSAQDIQNTNNQLRQISSNTEFLTKLASKPSVISTLYKVLEIPRKGITLSSFTYGTSVTADTDKVTLSGVAQTRTSLHRYQQLFKDAPFITSVRLPVNVYAENANIKFRIILTEKPITQ